VPVAPPRLPGHAFREPFSDAGLIVSLCRHTFLANLTGTPAASAPIGLDPAGIPTGLQLLGDAWDEPALLAVLAHLERAEVARVVRAPASVDLLG
jgi:aspartyl-tRNA(Asn)/glutamyl-tRNA(Gln) amidotransferase subunit A